MTLSSNVRIHEGVETILGWPTEVVKVDHYFQKTLDSEELGSPEFAHTVLIFIPGNPGCIGWYTKSLVEWVKKLGKGYAARGLSYACHSGDESIVSIEHRLEAEDRDASIPWTVDGQILHKSAFIDQVVMKDEVFKGSTGNSSPRFIFIGHSIGCHMVERLCILRPDILQRTICLLHLMPFTRMDSYPKKQQFLDWGAGSPGTVISIAKGLMSLLRQLPKNYVDSLATSAFEDKGGRELAVNLLRQPPYARNFFELGMEELRDVPNFVDVPALRFIGKRCPIYMLYCANDQWGPEFHVDDIKELQLKNIIPKTISVSFIPNLRHDYVSCDHMVPITIDWCFENMKKALQVQIPRSKL